MYQNIYIESYEITCFSPPTYDVGWPMADTNVI